MGIYKYFDRLEDGVRYFLSHWPILYALIGGLGIVLFWRGVELTADYFVFMTGPVSLIIGILIMMISGVLVSFFIGDQILISGMKHEKKITEKTSEEIKSEEQMIAEIHMHITKISDQVDEINKKINNLNTKI
jgi:hypothetical protein